jgi:hypothetical protein
MHVKPETYFVNNRAYLICQFQLHETRLDVGISYKILIGNLQDTSRVKQRTGSEDQIEFKFRETDYENVNRAELVQKIYLFSKIENFCKS